MKNPKYKKILVSFLIGALILQAGLIGYSMIGNVTLGFKSKNVGISPNTEVRNQIDSNGKSEATGVVKEDNNIKDQTSNEISQEILGLIKSADPDNYNRNVDNYRKLLKDLNVHIIYKNEIERLMKKGFKVPDILTSYTFLNDCYGNMNDLEAFLKEKKKGMEWADIFKEYNKKHPTFMPSNFDSMYLDKLLKTQDINQDDLMIADRVSQNAKVDFSDVINKRINGVSWRAINAQYKIVNGLEESPHLNVTGEQLERYATQSKLTEEEVIDALTISRKLGSSADSVLKSMKQGLSKEEIYAGAYLKKFN